MAARRARTCSNTSSARRRARPQQHYLSDRPAVRRQPRTCGDDGARRHRQEGHSKRRVRARPDSLDALRQAQRARASSSPRALVRRSRRSEPYRDRGSAGGYSHYRRRRRGHPLAVRADGVQLSAGDAADRRQGLKTQSGPDKKAARRGGGDANAGRGTRRWRHDDSAGFRRSSRRGQGKAASLSSQALGIAGRRGRARCNHHAAATRGTVGCRPAHARHFCLCGDRLDDGSGRLRGQFHHPDGLDGIFAWLCARSRAARSSPRHLARAYRRR